MRGARAAVVSNPSRLLLCLSLCFFSVCALLIASSSESDCIGIKCSSIDTHHNTQDWLRVRVQRRKLGGPGSYPPRCIGKCGKCTPCRAVRVTVPPGGTPVTTEYYPEAWRCKCGNRLYIP